MPEHVYAVGLGRFDWHGFTAYREIRISRYPLESHGIKKEGRGLFFSLTGHAPIVILRVLANSNKKKGVTIMTTLTTVQTKDGEGLGLDEAWLDHPVPVLKGWESSTGWFWFATELNDNGHHFGFVQGFEDEWGSFSEKELADLYPQIWENKADDLPHSGRRTPAHWRGIYSEA